MWCENCQRPTINHSYQPKAEEGEYRRGIDASLTEKGGPNCFARVRRCEGCETVWESVEVHRPVIEELLLARKRRDELRDLLLELITNTMACLEGMRAVESPLEKCKNHPVIAAQLRRREGQ